MRKHYFKDENMVVCKETGGEWSIKLWGKNITKGYCICCLEPINLEELRK